MAAVGVALITSACARFEPPEPSDGVVASRCGTCHSEQYEAWSSSRHGNSDDSPVFLALLPRVEESWGATARARCEGCHRPTHTRDAVITCISCHAATGNRGGDGSILLSGDLTIGGPSAISDAPHVVRQSELLGAPDLCGSCHELTGPGLFVEPTHTEYRESWAADEGVSCADCHMPDRGLGPVADGATTERARRGHGFVGFDPPWGASEDEARRAAEATRELLAAALELEIEQVGEALEVRLVNRGAGHNVPTGASWLRDLWVDVELEDGDGALRNEARVLELGARPMAGDDEVALATDADRIVDLTLAPDEVLVGRVELGGAVRARVQLRGRALRNEIVTALGLEEHLDELPVHAIHDELWER